jgi:hypothetical protein
MSDISGGPGWWEASDRKWYRPEQHPDYKPPPPATLAPPPQFVPPPGGPPTHFAPPLLAETARDDLRGRKKWLIGGGAALVLAVVLLVAFVIVPGGHSAQWKRGYAFGQGAQGLPGGALTISRSGRSAQVGFDQSSQICSSNEISSTAYLAGVGGFAGTPEEQLAEESPTQDFRAGCISGVEELNAGFLTQHGLSASCSAWQNVKGDLPGC